MKNERAPNRDSARRRPTGGYRPLPAAPHPRIPVIRHPPAREKVNVPDDGCATTTAVAADVADDDPDPFDAVTTTRTVDPTSAPANTYELAVAPATSTQPHPPNHNRRH